MPEWLKTVLLDRFVWGLVIGLAFSAYVWWRGYRDRRRLKKKNEELTRHINTQMELTAKGKEELREEVEDMREKNENLRVSVKTLENKPGRAELRTLNVYDRAIHLMNERAPGFAPAWEAAVREAEQEVEESETGLRAMVRRFFSPSLPETQPERRGMLEEGEENQNGENV
jgi:hypothetical protein